MRPLAPLLAACALCAASLAQAPADEARMRGMWAKLAPADKAEVAEWFAHEVRSLQNVQTDIVRKALETQERDPGLWPRAAEPPVYDPKRHAPAQPIPRKVLDPQDPKALREQKRLLSWRAGAPIDAAYRYDWGRREIVSDGRGKDPERVFAMGVQGLGPDVDLVIALSALALDGGGQQAALAAFSHAYTDREGTVYPGITLYDAWCSGAELEMPDVDSLGIVHDVFNDWKSYKAPVRASQHDALYARIESAFVPARSYRALREAVAEVSVRAKPPLDQGYSVHLDRLHALWEHFGRDRAVVAEALPKKAEDVNAFLTDWTEKAERTSSIIDAGRERRRQLELSEAEVSRTLARVLQDYRAATKNPH